MSIILILASARERSNGLDTALASMARGETVGAIALSSEHVPQVAHDRLTGRASWVAPLTPNGFAIVGAVRPTGSDGGLETAACGVRLSDAGVSAESVHTAGLAGVMCGHVDFDRAAAIAIGAPIPLMATIRILLAAAGIGMGHRALDASLQAARRYERTGPGGEQTAQGLLADSATELDAALLLTWKAATSAPMSLADASMAKLAATDATQRAVARASQVIGGDAFRHGHPVERLAQDVRALELFAGRTEALREAVALETLPHGQ